MDKPTSIAQTAQTALAFIHSTHSAFTRFPSNAGIEELSNHKTGDPAKSTQTATENLDSAPQLDMRVLMQQWNLAAVYQAALINSIKGVGQPYMAYGVTNTPACSNLAPPLLRPEESIPQTSVIPGIGLTTRRRLNQFKPPPVKKYRCDECGKAFSRSNTLVTHKRIHSGEKPFECDLCGRAFRQPGNLTRHKLTHTTLKPYICPTCSKAFNRASNLHTHMRTHSTLTPCVCYICGKQFQRKVDLNVHFYSHQSMLQCHTALQ